MQIHVIGQAPEAAPQLRAYAEYRVFSRLAPLAREVLSVQVVMTLSKGGETVCAVCADLGPAGSTQARSRHLHPIRALDLVADRLADATLRHMRGGAEGGLSP
jgi:ribosome-associated translation inhibitor RaiA